MAGFRAEGNMQENTMYIRNLLSSAAVTNDCMHDEVLWDQLGLITTAATASVYIQAHACTVALVCRIHL